MSGCYFNAEDFASPGILGYTKVLWLWRRRLHRSGLWYLSESCHSTNVRISSIPTASHIIAQSKYFFFEFDFPARKRAS